MILTYAVEGVLGAMVAAAFVMLLPWPRVRRPRWRTRLYLTRAERAQRDMRIVLRHARRRPQVPCKVGPFTYQPLRQLGQEGTAGVVVLDGKARLRAPTAEALRKVAAELNRGAV